MNAPHTRNFLPDIQNLRPEIPLAIQCVGIKALRTRILVPDSKGEWQQTVATCDLGASLSSAKRGTHMSRLVELLEGWDNKLELGSIHKLLTSLCSRLESDSARLSFNFPFFLRKASPFGAEASIAYDCAIKAELNKKKLKLNQSLEVPVMTVCPCSRAISEEGAHSQRAIIRLQLYLSDLIPFDALIKLAENSASSPLYTLLKREDEKFVTEQAFANPAFVEDVARKMLWLLKEEKMIKGYKIEVESMESIHNHNAFAFIEELTDGEL